MLRTSRHLRKRSRYGVRSMNRVQVSQERGRAVFSFVFGFKWFLRGEHSFHHLVSNRRKGPVRSGGRSAIGIRRLCSWTSGTTGSSLGIPCRLLFFRRVAKVSGKTPPNTQTVDHESSHPSTCYIFSFRPLKCATFDIAGSW